jgi:hypothetical protein
MRVPKLRVIVLLALTGTGCLRIRYDRCREDPPHPDCFDAALDGGQDAERLDAPSVGDAGAADGTTDEGKSGADGASGDADAGA